MKVLKKLILILMSMVLWCGVTQAIECPVSNDYKKSESLEILTQQNNYRAFLIEHVKQSIKNAETGISKLSDDILKIRGASSSKVRRFLNNLCSLKGTQYLEIGVWRGSTFISSLYDNEEFISSAIGIDNWSEFRYIDGVESSSAFAHNIAQFLKPGSFKFYDVDSFTVNKKEVFSRPVNIYFYDGNHSYDAQKAAFTYFNDILDDVFVAIVDDWNVDSIKAGTRAAFAELNYNILFEIFLPARFNGDIENWWNGLFVAVIAKTK